MKKFFFIVISLVIGTILGLSLLEVTFRFLPVQSTHRKTEVNDQNPIVRYQPNREFWFSKGWNFSILNHGHTNNYGFVSNQDYVPSPDGPLMMIIGDSFVAARMVPYPDTMEGRLAKEVKGQGNIYSMGVGGAPMSQYLAFAEFAKTEFQPESMAILVVGNDFDESLSPKTSFHHFVETEGNQLVLKRKNYKVRWKKQLLRESALLRYLFFNVSVGDLYTLLRRPDMQNGRIFKPAYVGNTSSDASEQRALASKRVVDAFLTQLPARAGLAPSDILILVDGIRPHLYAEASLAQAKGSYFDVMRRYLLQMAAERGYETIDMQPVFRARHEQDGTRFEYPIDGHWNGHAHGVAAERIMASEVFARTFGFNMSQR